MCGFERLRYAAILNLERVHDLARDEHLVIANTPSPAINDDSDLFIDSRLRELQSLCVIAQAEYRTRRSRDALFKTEGLFSEPAWDILLDLFIAYVGGKTISISSACIASCVPQTTALRWIDALESAGFVGRYADPKDRRRSLLKLTPVGLNLMLQYLQSKFERQ